MSSGKRPQQTDGEECQQLLDLGPALQALLVDGASEAELAATVADAERRQKIAARRAEEAFVTALVGADLADDHTTPPGVRTFVRRRLWIPARRGIPMVVPRGLRELHAGITRVVWRAKRESLTLTELRAAAEADLPEWHDPFDVLVEVARRGNRGLRVVKHHVLVDRRPSRVADEVVGAWVAKRYGARSGRSIERRIRESAPAVSPTSRLTPQGDAEELERYLQALARRT